jgi:hypothetical protein
MVKVTPVPTTTGPDRVLDVIQVVSEFKKVINPV